MVIDDTIILAYLNGDCDSYRSHQIFDGFVFQMPSARDREWVAVLYDKLVEQIRNFSAVNHNLVRQLFPQFDTICNEYTIMLVVGFPDPYDAMVMRRDGREFMIFDLLQFTETALADDYSCHAVLTHELLHIALHQRFPVTGELSYREKLDYIAFDEGFAHALSYTDSMQSLDFSAALDERYRICATKLARALDERDELEREKYLREAVTGRYWDKFASIGGMLYILKNIDRIDEICSNGWHCFAEKVIKGANL